MTETTNTTGTKFQVSGFSADLYNADDKCMMTGCASASVEATIEAALEVATSERGYAHHATVKIEVHALCACCGGTGRVTKRRFAIVKCPKCKGEGSVVVATARAVNGVSS